MQVDEATEGRRLRKRKEKIPKNLKREANEKEMDGFTKRVLRIPVEKPFDEVYFTHWLWMFFRETKETEEDIRRMFHHVREMMKLRITLKKKSNPRKFAIPCVVNLVELGNDLGYIAACHCGAEYEIECSELIDTHTVSSIDSNESPTTDEHYPTSLDEKHPVDHFTLPDQCYPNFSFQEPNKRGRDDYSIGSWADSGFHESFAVEIDDRYSSYSFNNTFPPSIDRVYSASVNTHPHPAKRSYASIDTTPGTSIDIKAAALKKGKGNIPIPSRDPDGHARAMDGSILQVSREDIADILQVANGPDNLFIQQRNIPDNIPAVPDKYPRADTTEIGSHQSCRPVGQASIDKVAPTSFDREISSELTIRGRYEEEAIVRCTSSVVNRYRREASTIEDYDRSIYILYHRSMSRREMRDLVPADFKPKASPNYKITPDEFLT
ncbi:hypothetical protein DY000_02053861 [Brassica cretica]|uniref:Uncharacterized protein n=1 Tax=Brassica cretica TaxID=69181 RepID=A0ABQ7A9W3_BRACR|nr:hypothetical protein DY000_02053861 [Brassica cretica]